VLKGITLKPRYTRPFSCSCLNTHLRFQGNSNVASTLKNLIWQTAFLAHSSQVTLPTFALQAALTS
jgi:hypothetical protein